MKKYLIILGMIGIVLVVTIIFMGSDIPYKDGIVQAIQ